LRILYLTLTDPVNPEARYLYGVQACPWNSGRAAEAITHDEMPGPALTGVEKTGNICGVVLAIAIQGHHPRGSSAQGFGKAMA
jgi:hypothetical protein